MGIRIHKCLGYGISDLKADNNYRIDDPRIRFEKFKELREKWYELKVQQLQEWAVAEKDKIVAIYSKYEHPNLEMDDFEYTWFLHDFKERADQFSAYESLVWQAEYGLPNVMLFVPPFHKRWHRYDDTLDYCEETATRDDTQNRTISLTEKCGIYPYVNMIRFRPAPEGIWKDAEAEKRHALVFPSQYNQLVGRWSKDKPPILTGASLKHFLEDYRPSIPVGVYAMVWFFREAFENPEDFINCLRPMIYIYWS